MDTSQFTDFRKAHGLMGGAPIDVDMLFASERAKRLFRQFKEQYAITSAHEWIVVPTKYQDPQVRERIGQITLYTFNCTVPDHTELRMAFQTQADAFLRNAGYVPYLVDMAHAWDNEESVVLGFHAPIPLYKPEQQEDTRQRFID